jgi:hypothetical protein
VGTPRSSPTNVILGLACPRRGPRGQRTHRAHLLRTRWVRKRRSSVLRTAQPDLRRNIRVKIDRETCRAMGPRDKPDDDTCDRAERYGATCAMDRQRPPARKNSPTRTFPLGPFPKKSPRICASVSCLSSDPMTGASTGGVLVDVGSDAGPPSATLPSAGGSPLLLRETRRPGIALKAAGMPKNPARGSGELQLATTSRLRSAAPPP